MLNKSVQVMLDALNELRVLHVTEKAVSYSTSRDASKVKQGIKLLYVTCKRLI